MSDRRDNPNPNQNADLNANPNLNPNPGPNHPNPLANPVWNPNPNPNPGWNPNPNPNPGPNLNQNQNPGWNPNPNPNPGPNLNQNPNPGWNPNPLANPVWDPNQNPNPGWNPIPNPNPDPNLNPMAIPLPPIRGIPYQRYVDMNMVGTGYLQKAAILALPDGSVRASSRGFNIAQDAVQVKDLFREKPCDTPMRFTVGGEHFLRIRTEKSAIHGKRHGYQSGCIIEKTEKSIVIGVYDEVMIPSQAVNCTEKMADYLRGQECFGEDAILFAPPQLLGRARRGGGGGGRGGGGGGGWVAAERSIGRGWGADGEFCRRSWGEGGGGGM